MTETMNDHVFVDWYFNEYGNTQGWVVPEALLGEVQGGALSIRIASQMELANKCEENLTYIIAKEQMYSGKLYEIASPEGLGISASEATKVKLRLLNLSPETDGTLRWCTFKNEEAVYGQLRFTMLPYCRDWQEVTCHVDVQWSGVLDRIWLTLGHLGRRGDIWIRHISITDGLPRKPTVRPDIRSSKVVPLISIPGISQDDFQMAFDILDECMVLDVPVAGFPHPLLAPGGAYGWNWWQLDTSLNLAGAKWVNQCFAEDVIRGFIEVQSQNLDGRIDLWGGSPIRGACGDLSSIPRYFEAAFDVARRSSDLFLVKNIQRSISRYLAWWLSPVKRDYQTGLITGLSEETLGGVMAGSQEVAPVDLNVAVALGCRYAADLSARLGMNGNAQEFEAEFIQLCLAINTYLWDEDKGAYFSYDVKKHERLPNFICTTFDVFRLCIAPPDRVMKLIPQLLDPELFNWGSVPVTSVARTDKNYCEAVGEYDGRAWYGDIWTMRNLPIISGLEDIGRYDLAAELAWLTIKRFSGNYAEYLEPSYGEGHGVKRYGWSASQYIQTIIEHFFGIDFDQGKQVLQIFPRIPAELYGIMISIKHLILPVREGVRLNLDVTISELGCGRIDFCIYGDLGASRIEVLQPLREKEDEVVITCLGEENRVLPAERIFEDVQKTNGVRLTAVQKASILFN